MVAIPQGSSRMDPVQYRKYWNEYEGMLKELLPLTTV